MAVEMADKEGDGRPGSCAGFLERYASGMGVRAIVEQINGEHPEPENGPMWDSLGSSEKED